MDPSISVIVPAHNRFQMLVLVVESILAQTSPVLEVLVIDDGSLDETPEQMPRLVRERPGWRQRVRYIRQNNQGQSVAFNRGISEARGDWLGFCGHDDLWLPWKLEWQIRAIRESGVRSGLCFTDAWFMNNPHMKGTVFQFDGDVLPDQTIGQVFDPIALVTRPHTIWVQTVIAQKDSVLRAGQFDPYLRYSEDHDFIFRMALTTGFCFVNMPLVLIDRSPAAIRHSGASEQWHRVEYRLSMNQYRYEKQLAMSAGLSTEIARRIRRSLRSVHSHWATHFLERRNFSSAQEALRVACQYDLSVSLAAKRLLAKMAPSVARRIFMAYDRFGNDRPDITSWETEVDAKQIDEVDKECERSISSI